MADLEKKVAEIVAEKLGKDVDSVKEAYFTGCGNTDGKITVTAHAVIGSYIYSFTDDGILPYYTTADSNVEAMQKFVDVAEKLDLMKEKKDNEEMKENVNFKKIVGCLMESYRRQMDAVIKELAEDTAAEIIEESYLLQTNKYEEITYDAEIEADESSELADNHFEIGGKIDWEAVIEKTERKKLKDQLEQLKAKCTETDI